MESSEAREQIAELGMYPFASARAAWDALWAAIRSRVGWVPERLTWTGDCEATWGDRHCSVTHMCAWPFATRHRADFELVGAFDLDLPDAEPGGRYRSVLLSPHDQPLDELLRPTTRAVANDERSLSGWLSLLAVTVEPGGRWPGSLAISGSHLDSVRALASDDADLASIDSWSLALITDEWPDLLAGLHRVGVGPVVPTPAVAVRSTVDDTRIAALRRAFADTLADPAAIPGLSSVLARLHIRGAAPLAVDDYLAIVPGLEQFDAGTGTGTGRGTAD